MAAILAVTVYVARYLGSGFPVIQILKANQQPDRKHHQQSSDR
jgi:hypothetical protein